MVKVSFKEGFQGAVIGWTPFATFFIGGGKQQLCSTDDTVRSDSSSPSV